MEKKLTTNEREKINRERIIKGKIRERKKKKTEKEGTKN